MTGEFGRLFRSKPLSPKEARELLNVALYAVAVGIVVATYRFVHYDFVVWGWYGLALAFYVLVATSTLFCAGWLLLSKVLPFLFRPIGATKK